MLILRITRLRKPSKWRQQTLPKPWYFYVSLPCIAHQNTEIFNSTAVIASNLANISNFQRHVTVEIYFFKYSETPQRRADSYFCKCRSQANTDLHLYSRIRNCETMNIHSSHVVPAPTTEERVSVPLSCVLVALITTSLHYPSRTAQHVQQRHIYSEAVDENRRKLLPKQTSYC